MTLAGSAVTLAARKACSPKAFEQRYQALSDPWQFASSPHELNRYDVTLRSLRRSRYRRAFEPGGELIAVHWLGSSDDHMLHGDEVHATLRDSLPLNRVRYERDGLFRLDSWVRE